MTNPGRPDQSKWHLDWSPASSRGGSLGWLSTGTPVEPAVRHPPLLDKGGMRTSDGDIRAGSAKAKRIGSRKGVVLRLTDVPEVRRRYQRFQAALPRAQTSDGSGGQLPQPVHPRWFLGQPGRHRKAIGKLPNLFDESVLVALSRLQERVAQLQRRETLVDDPRKRSDSGALDIPLQLRRFVDRRCLRQGHDEHLAELRIAQTRQQAPDRLRQIALRPQYLAW